MSAKAVGLIAGMCAGVGILCAGAASLFYVVKEYKAPVPPVQPVAAVSSNLPSQNHTGLVPIPAPVQPEDVVPSNSTTIVNNNDDTDAPEAPKVEYPDSNSQSYSVNQSSPPAQVESETTILPPSRQEAVTTKRYFEKDLESYGEWEDDPEYGVVWYPRVVNVGWRPYSEGRWVWCDYGWMWVSDEPWGRITYHYGRWCRGRYGRWIWVPGREWAPAWVCWRSGGGYVGWAPLPPEPCHRSTYVRISIDDSCWSFVTEPFFHRPISSSVIVHVSHNLTIINRTNDCTDYYRSGVYVVNRGPRHLQPAAGHRHGHPASHVVQPKPIHGSHKHTDFHARTESKEPRSGSIADRGLVGKQPGGSSGHKIQPMPGNSPGFGNHQNDGSSHKNKTPVSSPHPVAKKDKGSHADDHHASQPGKEVRIQPSPGRQPVFGNHQDHSGKHQTQNEQPAFQSQPWNKPQPAQRFEVPERPQVQRRTWTQPEEPSETVERPSMRRTYTNPGFQGNPYRMNEPDDVHYNNESPAGGRFGRTQNPGAISRQRGHQIQELRSADVPPQAYLNQSSPSMHSAPTEGAINLRGEHKRAGRIAAIHEGQGHRGGGGKRHQARQSMQSSAPVEVAQ